MLTRVCKVKHSRKQSIETARHGSLPLRVRHAMSAEASTGACIRESYREGDRLGTCADARVVEAEIALQLVLRFGLFGVMSVQASEPWDGPACDVSATKSDT
jgi:hypothetical protein